MVRSPCPTLYIAVTVLINTTVRGEIRISGRDGYHRGFITTVTAIYGLGHGLRTFTAVPRSIQPSTVRGTVKYQLSD